jgi:hypothetical protein
MRAQTILFLLVDRVKGKLNGRPYRGGGEGNPKRLVEAASLAFSNRSNILTIRVLRSQIFVSQQQFLIDGAGDVGQHASPNHFVPLWLIELKRSWIVVLIEAVEKPAIPDSSRMRLCDKTAPIGLAAPFD